MTRDRSAWRRRRADRSSKERLMTLSREVRLARRPAGAPTTDDFVIESITLSQPGPGQFVVHNRFMSVDPYMRLPMTGREGVHAPMDAGQSLTGAAIGVVEQSAHDGWPVGAWVVSGTHGWREAYLSDGAGLTRLDALKGEPSLYVGLLGLIGVTAFAGIEGVLKPGPGDSVFISGAAGAVGSVACQLAKRRGARVLGTTGSDEKVAWLRDELGLDEAVNYKTAGDLRDVLETFAPGGLTMMFDNVGGETLEATIDVMKPGGHLALCGAIALYNGPNYRAGPANFFTIIEKCLRVEGFNAGPYYSRAGEIFDFLGGLVAGGQLIWRETVRDGIEAAPSAFVDMMAGANIGKMLVRL
jgi:NADPH-dependent curcumin reductase CurA